LLKDRSNHARSRAVLGEVVTRNTLASCKDGLRVMPQQPLRRCDGLEGQEATKVTIAIGPEGG